VQIGRIPVDAERLDVHFDGARRVRAVDQHRNAARAARRSHLRQRQHERQRRTFVARSEHRRVGADAEEGGVAEADEPGGADERERRGRRQQAAGQRERDEQASGFAAIVMTLATHELSVTFPPHLT